MVYILLSSSTIDGQLPIVNQGQAVARLVRIIRELRPEVLITFGPAASTVTTTTGRASLGDDCV